MPSPPPLRLRTSRLRVAAGVALAILLGACSNPGSPGIATQPPASTSTGCPAIPPPNPEPAGWGMPAEAPSVLPILITTPVICGPNRVLFTFVDKDNRPLSNEDRSASLAIYELGRNAAAPIATVQGEFVWAIEGFSGIYIANLSVPSSGRYGAEFVTAVTGSPSETIRVTFDVQPSSPVVKVGDEAPASRTPTLADVDGDVSLISTDDDPEPELYETSVDEALADHEPFVLVFATPKFCQTAQCGPTLDRIKPFMARYPTVTFINVEPYELALVDGSLEPVLDERGFPKPVPVSVDWGLIHEPIVFVVDREGTVQGAFELVFGDAELTAVLDVVQ